MQEENKHGKNQTEEELNFLWDEDEPSAEDTEQQASEASDGTPEPAPPSESNEAPQPEENDPEDTTADSTEDRQEAAPIPKKGKAPKEKPSAISSFVEVVEIFVGALIATILVLTLVCRTGVVSGSSMSPTMYGGDRYLISDLFYTPKQGDIVVFRSGIEGEDELWIKRVIATEGQTVYIDPNTYEVLIDGQKLDEPYLVNMRTVPHTTQNPITVPEGCVYVMGDNRSVSHDSRYSDLGCVSIGQLAGHVLFRFWPLNSFGVCK